MVPELDHTRYFRKWGLRGLEIYFFNFLNFKVYFISIGGTGVHCGIVMCWVITLFLFASFPQCAPTWLFFLSWESVSFSSHSLFFGLHWWEKRGGLLCCQWELHWCSQSVHSSKTEKRTITWPSYNTLGISQKASKTACNTVAYPAMSPAVQFREIEPG